jgi:hypothetical protein
MQHAVQSDGLYRLRQRLCPRLTGCIGEMAGIVGASRSAVQALCALGFWDPAEPGGDPVESGSGLRGAPTRPCDRVGVI